MKRFIYLCAAALIASCGRVGDEVSPRTEVLLEAGWKFTRGDVEGAAAVGFDDSDWEEVCVPHDWAITGPFDREIDLQRVAVVQNAEKKATLKTGRSGGLPYIGAGWYRRSITVPEDAGSVVLLFDGAMSEARIYVNGKEIYWRPYGYVSFWCDITDAVQPGENLLAVRLENLPNSSRWYPGAGLYRNVHLITTSRAHIPLWGTYVTTPIVSASEAEVRISTEIENAEDGDYTLKTLIYNASGRKVATAINRVSPEAGCGTIEQSLTVRRPSLWSPESPSLYRAVSELRSSDGELADRYETVFGIRSIEYRPYSGFYLNGELTKFKGVCNHHDLGPLGAAINESALRHQLELLQDMGCNAVRTSHNMPAPELVRLCDEMGLMMMIEPFDEWDVAKCANGYHRFFDEWAEKDMTDMLHYYRNNPSVVMWSIGNEVPTQCSPDGAKVAAFLQDICHREDPTRPVTCGMDRVDCILENGFAAAVDVPGINYRTFRYQEVFEDGTQGFVLGSETASSVSSRGVYKLPVMKRYGAKYDDHQCSSYDVEACPWANIPDVDLALSEDCDWLLGQFVWTGFDYLGEPSPYDTDSWPNHSSMFGIIDLASIPKDRFYLYRSVWNEDEPTLHILPHWNWEGHEGSEVPVFVYTSWPSAELFINGKSYGVRSKSDDGYAIPVDSSARSLYHDIKGLGDVNAPVESRYRLMWPEAVYEPGEVRVVAYDQTGKAVQEKVVRTAGEPARLVLSLASDGDSACGLMAGGEALADAAVSTGGAAGEMAAGADGCASAELKADGKDLAYVTVSVVDADGNPCPLDSSLVRFKVSGAGSFKAVANGDPTCLEPFHLPQMHLFNGKLTVIISSSEEPGEITLKASADGLHPATLTLRSK